MINLWTGKTKERTLRLFATASMLGVLATAASSAAAAPLQDSGLKKGTIFFAPMNEVQRQDLIVGLNNVTGTEVYTSWGDIEKEEGVYDWSSIDAVRDQYKAKGKKITIRIATANFSINDTPSYVFTKYNVRRIAEGVNGSWMSFENGLKEYRPGPAGSIASEGPYVLMGGTSLRATGNGIALSTGPSQVLDDKDGYSLQFDYRLVTDSAFYVRITDGKGRSVDTDFSGLAGERGAKTVEFTPENDALPYTVSLGIRSGDLSLDNLNICERKTAWFTGTLCFPDYLDPTFETLYEKFVAAFAAKYGADPDVAGVCIGGYGRWEEITLCDDARPFRFEDQWESRGFTNAKYIDHIRWCIDTYQRLFSEKSLYMCAIGYPGADAFRDQTLIDWKITGYLADHGVGIKYNGWQHMSDEWGVPNQAIFYQMNRYKNDPGVTAIFEEGGQIDNLLSEVMGHPLSLLNKAILNGVDYYWVYSNDILDPFVGRYLHYAEEAAGATLVTKLYDVLGRTDYFSLSTSRRFGLYNQHMGLFQTDTKVALVGSEYKVNPQTEFTTVAGVSCVRTTAGMPFVAFSIDDRQKYNGMYGAVLSIDYLDEGSDSFDVYGYTQKGEILLGSIAKTGTGEWRTASFRDFSLFNTFRNGMTKDMGREIAIDDRGDGVETIRSIEVNYVPARDFMEAIVSSSEPVGTVGTSLDDAVSFEIATDGSALSGIAVPVSPDVDYAYVNIKAKVQAIVGGQTVDVASKDWFMPEPGDWLYVPVANKPRAERYVVTLSCDAGSARVLTAADGKPAYRTYRFAQGLVQDPVKATEDGQVSFEALAPFASLNIAGKDLEGCVAVLSKRMPGGVWATGVFEETLTTAEDGGFVLTVEPQTSGVYQLRLVDPKGELGSVAPVGMVRAQASNPATRYLLGVSDPAFAQALAIPDASWKVLSGLKKQTTDAQGILSAMLSAENPVIETGSAFRMNAESTHVFHAVLKNGTSASFLKLWWKTEGGDYDEADTVLVPVLPNDDRFREYSWPVGSADGWEGTLTGLRVMPVYGHTDVGAVSVATLDLRVGIARKSAFAEPLDIAKVTLDGPVAASAAPKPTGRLSSWIVILLAAAGALVASAWVFLIARQLARRRNKTTLQ
jgi:hypothetical protein